MQLTNKKKYIIVIIGVLVTISIVGGAIWFYKQRQAAQEKRLFSKEKATAVEVAPVILDTIRHELKTAGTLYARDRVALRPETSGQIAEISFKPGQKVKKGQMLIRLDDTQAKAKLKETQASLLFTQSEFKKEAYLLKNKAGKKMSYDKAASELKMMEARVESAQHELEKTLIKAPFDGHMSIHDLSVGASVAPNTEMVTIVDIDILEVGFKVAEQHLSYVNIGMEIQLKIDQFPDDIYKATVEAIDPFVDPLVHSFNVRALLNNQQEILKPGLFTRIILPLEEVNNALLVPETAVERDGNEEFVKCVIHSGETSTAVKRLVVTGQRSEGRVEIIDGLNKDDVIITTGAERARDGGLVKVVNLASLGQGTDSATPANTTKL